MKRLVKILLPTVIFSFLLVNAVSDYSAIEKYLLSFNIWSATASLFVLLFVYPEGAYAWHKLLKELGGKISFSRSLYVWVVSNTSRYIPGTVWQYVSRVELAQEEGKITRKLGMASILAEIFFALSAASITSFLAYPLLNKIGIENRWIIFVIPFFLLILHPKISSQMIMLIARIIRKDLDKYRYELGISQTIKILPWFVLNFFINGVALVLLGDSVGLESGIREIYIYSGFYAFSWLIGYITFIAPGGVGVADLSLSYLLSFLMPLSLSSALALLFRFLLTISEAIVFIFVLNNGQTKILGAKK